MNNILELSIRCHVCKQPLNITHEVAGETKHSVIETKVSQYGNVYADPCPQCTKGLHGAIMAMIEIMDHYRENFEGDEAD